MPNLGSILKQEIARIARREIRAQTNAGKKASAQHRRHIATLRRRIDLLEKRLTSLNGTLAKERAGPPAGDARSDHRFVAKGLKSLRGRLGLSAESFGRLVGVSGQSIYNWERQLTTPRSEQLRLLASIRGIGKREAVARLRALDGGSDDAKTAAKPRAAARASA
jgi:DNA-binding XRE family transcriptional regulator